MLTYEDVLEYLSDREGDWATLYAYPTFHLSADGEHGEGRSTLLGLKLSVTVGKLEGVKPYEEQWLDGRAGARLLLYAERGDDGGGLDDGLVLTREWFGGAVLENENAALSIIVRANLGARPLYPRVGGQPERDDESEVFSHDLVGWGFTFDFDSSPPFTGRWAPG